VTNLDELVSSFSNGFEENQKLKDYAERLSSEIDELQISLNNTSALIDSHNLHSEKTEVEREDYVRNI
jgi:hypothetical protein